MAAQTDRGVPLSTLCPKFLHTNSTSHTWPFSAIAELIDNAYDPDVNAKQFWIDRIVLKDQECLSFMDNGNGLNLETMHKMLSFGYSDKTPIKGVKPIGMYGNGFKSGSMRLGRDAIVFSKSESVSCVGMLSQTYLEKTGANQISVPIVCFEQRKTSSSVREEHKASLQDILRYSPFDTQDELLREIDAISSNQSTGKTGTRIIIWNLRCTSTETTEFDFEKDRYDIRIPFDVYESMNDTSQQPDRATSHKPECCYSLRAYCSILYLNPRLQIIIRGQKVKSELIAKSLASVRKDHYKPTFLIKRVPIHFGYNTKSKEQYGIMMYHKNRLIKAYERVGCQLKANNKGVGVIGIIECDFLEPTHNKQSFNETDKYRKTMTNLGTKLEEYWNEMRYRRRTEDPNCTTPVEDTMKRPDQNWVQCDDCLKWRKLPDGIDCDKLPDKWYCYKNPNPELRSCQAEQEPVDSDDEQPSYRKTYKQQEREKKERQKIEEARKHREEQRLALLAKQKQAHRQLQTAHPPSTPTTPKNGFNTMSARGGALRAESSILLSQAACSPSSSGLPVITSVCSLSQITPRGKRTQPVPPQTAAKKVKINGVHLEKADTSELVDASPPNSPSLLADNDDDDTDDTDDTDDDIFILETVSTPKPVKSDIDLTKVKTEQEERDASMGMLLECNDDAAMDYASDTNVARTSSAKSAAVGTSPFPAPHAEVSSTTTQTEVPKVKTEKEDQTQTEGEERAVQSKSVSTDVAIGVCSINQENSESQGQQVSENGVTHHPDGTEEAGPSCAKACEEKGSPLHANLAEVQEQQDQLVELMQATAMERDSFKEQVHKLTCQLQDMKNKLQELTQEKELLLAATETKPCTAHGEENNNDEIALQVDNLMKELDERNNERDNLRSQLDSLKTERDNLAVDCAELRLSLHQQREKAQERRTADCAVQTEEEGATANPGTDSNSNTTRSLIELRHNVGRLLISYVPALDLGQVNYECNVIDEILEQYLSDVTNEAVKGNK